MAEFDWWLLVLGLVVGGGLVYLVLAENARREADVEARELEAEASYIAERLGDVGLDVSQPEVAEVLREHRGYLRLPPPDAIVSAADETNESLEPAVATPPPIAMAEPTETRPTRPAST